MQIVLNQPCAAQASQFADLVRMTLEFAKQQDYTNIRSLLVSIGVIPKALTSQILQENFATEKVTSLELKTNSVEPSVFLPQRNKCLIDQELINEMKATSKNIMDFTDSHKTKGKTAITCIGTMQNMTVFFQLMYQYGHNHHCYLLQRRTPAYPSTDTPQFCLNHQQSGLGTLVREWWCHA